MKAAVICGHNESGRIVPVLREMIDLTDFYLVLVDNNSTDQTYNQMKSFEGDRVLVLQQSIQGKAMAQRIGLDAALMSGAQTILTMDADGEHKPSDMLELYQSYESSGLDLIIGDRFPNQETPLKDRIVAECIRRITGILPRDPRCGARVYNSEVIQNTIEETLAINYGLDTELCLLALRNGYSLGSFELEFKKKSSVTIPLPSEMKNLATENAELTDLYRVFGRGDIERGRTLLNNHEKLIREFGNSSSIGHHQAVYL
ncbi:MAG: glycosyltransferase family 2 protein [Nanoarchaeota archaeon]|nr:glycosyltransferase family 2 protein [Nanoarchaeota archaeon]